MNCSTCGNSNPDGRTICASCGIALADAGGAPAHSLAPGTRLQGGAYTIGRVLGQGGFGITYKGGDMRLRCHVAIKEFFPQGSLRTGTTVSPTGGDTPEMYEHGRQSFLKEAITLARFSHPGIVRVFTVFEENNSAYMVMELLEGSSLQGVLNARGVLPEKDVVRIAVQIGDALTAVHAAGMLHRDIKPDNILIANDGRVVLIDFGTARTFTADKTSQVTTRLLTAGYAPLEQYGNAAKFGPYTDVYALAATLYHCLTGQVPVAAIDRLNGVELVSPDRVNPNVSPEVAQAVMAGMAIKAPERPQSAAEFTRLLQAPRRNASPAPPSHASAPSPVPPPPAWNPPPPAQVQPQPYSPPVSRPPSPWRYAWNLIWLAGVIWYAYGKIQGDPVQTELIDYHNNKLKPAVAMESQAIDAFKSALDEKYVSGLRADMTQNVIPLSEQFIEKIQEIDPQTEEVKALNDRLLALAKRRKAAYESIANQEDIDKITPQFDELKAVSDAEEQWFRDEDALCKAHDVVDKDKDQ